MAAKYFCDGCDKEIHGFSRRTHVFATIVAVNEVNKISEDFDLCESCGRRYLESAHPRKWPRSLRPEKAA